MSIPGWYELLLLSLAAYRIWRFVGEDDLFDRPRRWLVRLGPDWSEEGDPVPTDYRVGLASFLTCPWCLGFWVSLALWCSYQVWEFGTVIVSVPLAISSLVGFLRSRLDPAE